MGGLLPRNVHQSQFYPWMPERSFAVYLRSLSEGFPHPQSSVNTRQKYVQATTTTTTIFLFTLALQLIFTNFKLKK